ncbi:MAG TPA: phosphatidate cytidylyltransferase, partial [Acidimicrobiia bacterium]|nr:phosphatidate cytidylyltransferase [Acidimicrobiia bacterium]
MNDSGDDRTSGYDPDESSPDADDLVSSDSSDERDWSDTEAEEIPPPVAVEDTGEFVDLPAWATDVTRAADHVESRGFDGDTEVGSDPAPEDLDPDSYDREQETLFEVAPEAAEEPAPFDDARDPGAGPVPDDEVSPTPDVPHADTDMPHGVATERAYDALDADDSEDFDVWDEFVGSANAPPAEPDRLDDWPPEPMSRKERRRARKEARAAAKGATAGAEEGGRPRHRDSEPGPDTDGWVEADPNETAWLREGVQEEDPPEPGSSVFAPPPSRTDDTPPLTLPPPARPEEPVWLAAEQPLVGDAPSPDREPAAADAPDDEMGDGDEWFDEVQDGDDWDEAQDERQPLVVMDPDDDLELDADAYATSATREHRGLAEAIYQAGDEDLEWQAMSASMPGLGTGVISYDDVADLGGDEEDTYVERARSDLGTRVFTGFVLVGLLLGSMWVGREAFAIFVGLMVFIALAEYYVALRRARFRPIALFGFLGGLGVLFGAWFHGPLAIPVVVCLVAVVTYFVYAFAPLGRDALTNGGLTLLGVVWVTVTASFAFPLIKVPGFHALILTVVVATAAMDIGGYGFGRMMGRRRLAPLVSPNKTVEGLLGGIVATFAAAAGMSFVFEEISLDHALALAAVVSVLAPLGDLAESMFKRSMGIKDMGAILPGHGG